MSRSGLTEEDKEFAYAYLSDRENYHSHKERTANAIFLVETGFFSALMTTNWYSNLEQIFSCPKPIILLLIFIVWCLMHFFMRWQLRNRRVAAIQVATLITTLLDYIQDNECANEIKELTPACKFKMYLDFLYPISSATYIVKSDVGLNAYPEWYKKRFLVSQSTGTGATFGELFPTIGSLLMFFVAIGYVITIPS